LHTAQVGTRAFWRKHQAEGTLHPAQNGIKKKAKDRGTVQTPPGFVCNACGHSCEREASFTIDKRRGYFRRRCSSCCNRNKKEVSASSYNFVKLESIRKFFDDGRACWNTTEKKKAFANTIVKKIKSEPGLSEVARNAEDAMKNYFNHRTITSFFSPAPPAPSLLPPLPLTLRDLLQFALTRTATASFAPLPIKCTGTRTITKESDKRSLVKWRLIPSDI
jgi:hypothetical protein